MSVSPGTVVLDFDGVAGPLAFSGPRRVIEARAAAEVRPALAAVEAETAAGRWAAGFLAYEAGPGLDPALRARPDAPAPLLWFGIYEAPRERPPEAAGAHHLGRLEPEVDRDAHRAAVERIRARIARGDVYQVNLTFRLRGPFQGDPLGLYRRLRAGQGGGLSALVHLGDRALVSASPELFLERQGDLVRSRPMKGTARRGRYEEEDLARAAALAASAKDRAENVMIVDLVRNDLGRVARPASVRVASLLDVERWPTVLQLTSTVEARLAGGAGIAALLGAAFPAGSITGAPKAMATRVIAEEEVSARGAYCGAIGFVAPGGDAAFSVAIRTAELDLVRGEAAVGVGGGITWRSDADREWDEAMAKAAFLAGPGAPFELLETLRLEAGRYPLLPRHLARLGASARHLGFPLDPGTAEAALGREAAGGASGRVRLLLDRRGAIRTERAPLPAPPVGVARVALASRRVSREDPLLFHKTTRRDRYDAARAEHPGAFDVLLANEEGEVTEFTIGNLVADLDGERVTPPRDAGLLAGVMRAELLARGAIRERTVRIDDLGRARALWLVNAVRGEVPVRLGAPPGAGGGGDGRPGV